MLALSSGSRCSSRSGSSFFFFFFFQAEDGIRDVAVTGVQTCALPIWPPPLEGGAGDDGRGGRPVRTSPRGGLPVRDASELPERPAAAGGAGSFHAGDAGRAPAGRSEERRVGKECRSAWTTKQETKRLW